MIAAHSRSAPRAGTAAVEFALVSPLLFAALLGLWEVGRLVEAQQILTNAAREGARQGSTGQRSLEEVKNAVINYIAAAGFDTTGVVVTVTNVTQNKVDTDPREYNHLDHFRIDVSLPFRNVRWILVNRFTTDPGSGFAPITPPAELRAESHWFSMKDQVLEVSFAPPIE
ncbi:MAG TPA: TadE family protein [Gemmataceae bacterium]|nr:TadE family protein [Gemmataceae bacterium]